MNPAGRKEQEKGTATGSGLHTCLDNGLEIGGTIFQLKTIRRFTAISPGGKTSKPNNYKQLHHHQSERDEVQERCQGNERGRCKQRSPS